MTWDEFCAHFELVGTTVAAPVDHLPLRLNPVYRRLGESGVLYLEQMEESDGHREVPPQLVCESEEWVLAQVTMRFQPPIAPLPNHWLMQMKANRQPEYLPRLRVAHRIAESYADALRQAEQAAVRGAGANEVWSELWYAVRAAADPAEEILPRLALLPWLEMSLSGEDFSYFLHSLSQEVSEAVRKENLAALREGFPALGRALLRCAENPAIAAVCGVACYLDRMTRPLKNPAAVFPKLRSAWHFTVAKNPSSLSWPQL